MTQEADQEKPDSTESPETDKKKPDNKWWESYYVRYFVGTAIGAIIVLFLALSTSPVLTSQGEVSEILKSLKPEKFESGYIAVLATIGLAFCYLASAPILVLHATRGSLLKIQELENRQLILIFVVVTLAIAGGQIWKLWHVMKIDFHNNIPDDFYMGSILLFIVSFVFVGQFLLLWLSFFDRREYAYKYYDDLAKKRAEANKAGKEYMESYRHLREHGNAFFIALLELLLGAVLLYSPVPWAASLMLWVLPASCVWFFGTFLESREF